MNQLKFYKIALVVLVILNIAVVSSIFFNRKQGPPHHHKDVKFSIERAKEQLSLNAEQARKFEEAVLNHKSKIEGLGEKRLDLLQDYFSSILDENSRVRSEELLSRLTLNDRQKIEFTYEHFEEIKSFLNEDQMDEYEVFIGHAIGMILQNNNSRPNGKNHPPH